jgi:hypothetical protein
MVPFLSLCMDAGLPLTIMFVSAALVRGRRTPIRKIRSTTAAPDSCVARTPMADPIDRLTHACAMPGDFGLYLYLAPWTRAYAARTLTRRGRHMGEHDHRMRKRGKIVLIGFLLVASFFLLTEHTAHFLGVLPYLILLACPLMHLFMHRGHGGHQHGHEPGQAPAGLPANPNGRIEGESR